MKTGRQFEDRHGREKHDVEQRSGLAELDKHGMDCVERGVDLFSDLIGRHESRDVSDALCTGERDSIR